MRLPSERRDANIERSCVGDIHLDLLSDRDKSLYGKYKAGVLETGPQFDRHEEGADHDREGCCEMSEYDKTLDLVAHVNGELQYVLLRRACCQALVLVRFLEETPTTVVQVAHQLVLYLYLLYRHCGPTSLAKRLPAADTWVFANKSATGREYASNKRGSCFYESCN